MRKKKQTNKQKQKRKQEISTETSASSRLLLATALRSFQNDNLVRTSAQAQGDGHRALIAPATTWKLPKRS